MFEKEKGIREHGVPNLISINCRPLCSSSLSIIPFSPRLVGENQVIDTPEYQIVSGTVI